MSDSIPQQTENADRSKAAAALPIRRRREHDSLWVTVSLILHGAALVILWFTPVRQLVFKPRDVREFQVTARADRIEEMVDHLRDREAEIIDDYLEELFDIEEELEQILDTRREQFDTLATEWMEDAPTKALKAQEAAMQAQETALRAESQLIEQAPSYDEPAFNEINEAQADAGDSQREAAQALAFTGAHFEPVRQAQNTAEQAQTEASAVRDQAVTRSMELAQIEREDRDKERRAVEEQKRLEHEQQRVSEERARVDKGAAELEEARRRRAETAARLMQAQAERDARRNEAEDAAQSVATPDAKRRASDLKRVADNAGRDAEAKRREDERAASTVREREQRLKQSEERLAATRANENEARTRAETAAQAVAETKSRVADMRNTVRAQNLAARQVQAQAHDRQREAYEALKQSVATRTESQATQLPQTVRTPVPEQSRPVIRDQQSIPEIYDTAVATEVRVAETYKHVYATEVAMVRQLPVPDALAETVVAKTKRPELNRELLTQSVRTAEGAEAHRAEVNRANQEMSAIVTAAYRILDKARGNENGMSVSLASFRAAGARARKLRELAAEDDQARFKDLSSAMRDGAETGGAPPPSVAAGAQRQASREWRPQLERDPKDVLPGRIVVTEGARPRVMVPGNGEGAPSWRTPKWMYVDSWYTIGPFPNPGRRNIDTQFPPESVVDLDATYTGKDGKRVSWEFVNSGHPGVFPKRDESYAIYYAYTELWFDEAMDLVVAVGSDDNSRIWVNGHAVWTSARQLKSWRADEGFRTVHFKKGLNRVLYRVENGWRETLYSFMICLEQH